MQAASWGIGAPFIEAVRALKPYFFVRLLAGATMAAGVLLFVYHIWRIARWPSRLSST